jgi:hypothetical protein
MALLEAILSPSGAHLRDHSGPYDPAFLLTTNYCEYCCEDVCGGDPSCRSDSNKLGPRCLLPDPSAALEGRRRTAGRSRT